MLVKREQCGSTHCTSAKGKLQCNEWKVPQVGVCQWVCGPIDQSAVHLEDTADKGGDTPHLETHTVSKHNNTQGQTHTHSRCCVPLWPEALTSFSLLITSEWQKGCYFVAGALNRLIRKHIECSTSGSSPVSRHWWKRSRLTSPFIDCRCCWESGAPEFSKTTGAKTKQIKHFIWL